MRPLRKPIALTMGEPAGIAGEIVVKAWHSPDGGIVPPFVFLGDAGWLRAEAHAQRSHVQIFEVQSAGEALERFAEGIPVLPRDLPARPVHGKPSSDNAPAVIASIRNAVELVQRGEAAAVVTNPIHKSTLYGAGFSFPGHTEFLADLCKAPAPIMMLTVEGLRVVPVTVHLSLSDAIRSLTTESIVRAGRIVHASLRQDMDIDVPRLAVAALNPHAGESGALGQEEQLIIAPAVAALRAEGIHADGPLPADTLFHPQARARHDAVLCMYHDQALIPLKTIDFHHGVNCTLGLPIVRTSPDHGTAFDIAGKGIADPSSLLAALRAADRMGAARGRTA